MKNAHYHPHLALLTGALFFLRLWSSVAADTNSNALDATVSQPAAAAASVVSTVPVPLKLPYVVDAVGQLQGNWYCRNNRRSCCRWLRNCGIRRIGVRIGGDAAPESQEEEGASQQSQVGVVVGIFHKHNRLSALGPMSTILAKTGLVKPDTTRTCSP